MRFLELITTYKNSIVKLITDTSMERTFGVSILYNQKNYDINFAQFKTNATSCKVGIVVHYQKDHFTFGFYNTNDLTNVIKSEKKKDDSFNEFLKETGFDEYQDIPDELINIYDILENDCNNNDSELRFVLEYLLNINEDNSFVSYFDLDEEEKKLLRFMNGYE